MKEKNPCNKCIVNAICLVPCDKFIEYYDKDGINERVKYDECKMRRRFFEAWKIVLIRDLETIFGKKKVEKKYIYTI